MWEAEGMVRAGAGTGCVRAQCVCLSMVVGKIVVGCSVQQVMKCVWSFRMDVQGNASKTDKTEADARWRLCVIRQHVQANQRLARDFKVVLYLHASIIPSNSSLLSR